MITGLRRIINGNLENKIVRLLDGQLLLVQSDMGNCLHGITICNTPCSLTVKTKQTTFTSLELTDEEYSQLILLYKYTIAVANTNECWDKLQKNSGVDYANAYKSAMATQKSLRNQLLSKHIEEDRFKLNVK